MPFGASHRVNFDTPPLEGCCRGTSVSRGELVGWRADRRNCVPCGEPAFTPENSETIPGLSAMERSSATNAVHRSRSHFVRVRSRFKGRDKRRRTAPLTRLRTSELYLLVAETIARHNPKKRETVVRSHSERSVDTSVQLAEVRQIDNRIDFVVLE